jgi:hypothetical protein
MAGQSCSFSSLPSVIVLLLGSSNLVGVGVWSSSILVFFLLITEAHPESHKLNIQTICMDQYQPQR